MFAAIAGNQGAEHFVMGIVFLLLFSLKYALCKKAQMHCKAAEIQCIPVKMEVVKAFHYLHAAIHKAGDIVHHAHGGVELCVDDVQRNETALVVRKVCMEALADSGKALHAKVILFRVEFPNGSHQRVRKANSLFAALDGKADVVGQRDEQAFIQGVFQPLPDGFYQLIGEQQMLIRDPFQKFHQLLLYGRAGHAVAALRGFSLDFIARLYTKAQTTPGDD